MHLPSGTQLGPYRIEALLGAGGMGEVYRATDTRLKRGVAVKVLSSRLVTEPSAKQRFEREAHTASALNDPHICTIFDVGEHEGQQFLEIPALSRDGKLVAFLRGPGSFGSSVNAGQIWFKSLPDGEPFQLTKAAFRKQTINFAQDGSRVYFTQTEGPFAWNTYELPLLGGQEPKLFMANATGLSWIGSDRVLFSAIMTGIHMKLSTSNPSRTDERDVYVHLTLCRGWCTDPRCRRMGNG